MTLLCPEQRAIVSSMPRRRPDRPISWRRLAMLVFGFYLGLAVVIVLVFELVLPALAGASPSAPSGFNYGAIFSANFSRPFGWILAGIVILLAPLTLLVRATDRLGDRLAKWTRGGR
jgi:hypothetical protein